MVLKERVYSVLIVSSSEKFNVTFSAMLPETDYYPVNIVGSIAAAKREILERSYDFVMINAPLPDEYGTKFAIDVCNDRGAVALLLVKAEVHAEIHSKVVDQGVFTLSKPTSAQMLSQALQWMCATRERLRKLEKKTISIEDKMEEIRLVNRAKWLLIDNLKMTEADSHRFIEKQAMDRCITRREVAESLIRTYK